MNDEGEGIINQIIKAVRLRQSNSFISIL